MIRQAQTYLVGAVSGTTLIAAAVVAFVALVSLQALRDWPLPGLAGGDSGAAAVSAGHPAGSGARAVWAPPKRRRPVARPAWPAVQRSGRTGRQARRCRLDLAGRRSPAASAPEAKSPGPALHSPATGRRLAIDPCRLGLGLDRRRRWRRDEARGRRQRGCRRRRRRNRRRLLAVRIRHQHGQRNGPRRRRSDRRGARRNRRHRSCRRRGRKSRRAGIGRRPDGRQSRRRRA